MPRPKVLTLEKNLDDPWITIKQNLVQKNYTCVQDVWVYTVVLNLRKDDVLPVLSKILAVVSFKKRAMEQNSILLFPSQFADYKFKMLPFIK